MRWPWRKTPKKSDEAQRHLERVMEREPEVKNLGHELRAVQRRNHFSDMVNAAIVRGIKEDT
jgi:hypothetical protein